MVIIWMLMPASASARNICWATPGLRGHAQADDRNLRHVVVVTVALGAQLVGGFLHRLAASRAARRERR